MFNPYPTHQICACSSHEILSLKALAAPGASERLFDFRGARQVPAAIRGSCAAGCPRPSSASLDPHSAILRSRDPVMRRPHHYSLAPCTYAPPQAKCRSRVSCAMGGGEVTRSSDRSSGCAPGNHHLTHLPSPLSFCTCVRVIRLQLLPRRILQRTPSVHPASTTAAPCTATCPVSTAVWYRSLPSPHPVLASCPTSSIHPRTARGPALVTS